MYGSNTLCDGGLFCSRPQTQDSSSIHIRIVSSGHLADGGRIFAIMSYLPPLSCWRWRGFARR